MDTFSDHHFFSFPLQAAGLILPSIPPLTILTGDYINRIRQKGLNLWLLLLHALLSAITIILLLLLPWHITHPGGRPPVSILLPAVSSGLAAALLILVVVARFGVARLRTATMVPLVVMLLFIFGVGPFFGLPAITATKKNIRLLDAAYSARPLAAIISQIERPNEGVAVYKVRRDVEYGLSFYRITWSRTMSRTVFLPGSTSSSPAKRTPANCTLCWPGDRTNRSFPIPHKVLPSTKSLPNLRPDAGVRLSSGVGFQGMALCRTLLFKRRGCGSRRKAWTMGKHRAE